MSGLSKRYIGAGYVTKEMMYRHYVISTSIHGVLDYLAVSFIKSWQEKK